MDSCHKYYPNLIHYICQCIATLEQRISDAQLPLRERTKFNLFIKKVQSPFSCTDQFKPFQGSNHIPEHSLKPLQAFPKPEAIKVMPTIHHGLYISFKFDFTDASIIKIFCLYLCIWYHIYNMLEWFNWSLSASTVVCHN